MRIAIVDDIAEERKLLLKRLVAQLDIHKVQADILEYDCGESFLAAADGLKFDVVFLDIYMSGVNGIETAKKLRERDRECLLIFTTTSMDHALEGFQVRAMQYLVKPYTSRDIAELTNEILARIPKPDKYIDVKVNGSDIRLHFKDIIYANHFNKDYLKIEQKKKSVETKIELALRDNNFLLAQSLCEDLEKIIKLL